MKRLLVYLIISVLVIMISGCSKKQKKENVKPIDIQNDLIAKHEELFDINREVGYVKPLQIEEEVLDYSNIERRSYRVVVPFETSDEQVKATIMKITREKYEENKDIDGIAIFIYLDGMDTQGMAYFRGEWCPEGEWQNIRETSDRSSYKFNFQKISDRPSKESKKEKFGLTAAERKEIFYELVRSEDRAYEDSEDNPSEFGKLRERYELEVIKKYGITKEQANAISVEGVQNNWPMP
jgi:hypothetical protein